MSDHEETAKRLLPCDDPESCENLQWKPEQRCGACRNRPAVAAALAQAEAGGAKGPWNRCPCCDSPNAHLHPAVQHEGEVQPCDHPFHLPAEIARLRADNLRLSHEGLLIEKQAAEAERDYFRARLAEAERERDSWRRVTERITEQRDAAEAKGVRAGLQRAREIATGFSKPYEIDWWMTKTKKEISAIMCLDVADAIDAEIAKAEGKSPA